MNSDSYLLSRQFMSLGGRSIVLLDASQQPDLGTILDVVSDDILTIAPSFSVESRQREWLLSRMLMRSLIGYIPGIGVFGEPVWYGAVSGSLSHKLGHIAFAFGASNQNHSYGIDLESCRDLDPGVVFKIMNRDEQARLDKGIVGASSAVFSAKESIYKYLFNAVQKRFYFEAVELIDFQIAGDGGIMMFRTAIDLSRAVRAGRLLRIDFIKINLGGEDFWLTSARG